MARCSVKRHREGLPPTQAEPLIPPCRLTSRDSPVLISTAIVLLQVLTSLTTRVENL